MFRLYLFGGFRLERDGVEVRLPAQKSKALLAYLALYPQEHPREKLAALFWGDSSDHDARKSLRVAFQHLYKALGKEWFDGDYETVRLAADAPLWVDAREIAEFRVEIAELHAPAVSKLESLVSLYQGELLAGFYDDWILEAREQYKTQYIELLLKLVAHARAQSEYTNAADYAQKILAADRANEAAHQHLMFLFAAQGDRTAALKQFELCVAALDEELGVEPSAETIALAKKIKQQKTGGASAHTRLTNLPKPLTSFIGRENEIAELRAMLGRGEAFSDARAKLETAAHENASPLRAVTLTGAGGSGKTRLAIETGRALVDDFEHGVWWVELAPLADPALVPQQIAKALGIQEQPNVPLVETLAAFLRERELLLILDNCEHLIDACAHLANHLITQSPNVFILATSREGLNIPGEQIYLVTPLQVPTTRDEIRNTQYSAIQLFVERARLAQPQFVLEDANAAEVIQICQRLDGIPLAIELAAAQLKSIPMQEIATRLAERSDLADATRVHARQKTLYAAIDWSYQLLNITAQQLFRRVAVFVGGWTLEQAVIIAGGYAEPKTLLLPGDQTSAVEPLAVTAEMIVQNELASLAGKSLVQIFYSEQGTRYSILETIREYAREQLDASGETESLQTQHLNYFVNWIQLAVEQMHHADQKRWFRECDVELNNLRAALVFATARKHYDALANLVSALDFFWMLRGHHLEGRVWTERACALIPDSADTRARARAASAAASQTYWNEAHTTAQAYAEQALTLFTDLEDAKGVALMFHYLGAIEVNRDNFDAAASLMDQSKQAALRAQCEWLYSWALNLLGILATDRNEEDHAQDYFQAALTAAMKIQDLQQIARVSVNLGVIFGQRYNHDQAIQHFQDAIQLFTELEMDTQVGWAQVELGRVLVKAKQFPKALEMFSNGLRRIRETSFHSGIAVALTGIAVIHSHMGENIHAANLLGAAENIWQASDMRPTPDEQTELTTLRATLLQILDTEYFIQAWQVGHNWTREQAVAYALEKD
jgi:predicted ATPase/DNA-binding SARP family transcriptional activator